MAKVRNTSRKGRINDKKTLRFLGSFGFDNFCISAASKGAFDTISWNGKGCVFVQNKSNSLPSRDEILKLIKTPVPACAVKLLFIWEDGAKIWRPNVWLISDEEIRRLDYIELSEILGEYSGSDSSFSEKEATELFFT